tara:strand:- start:793 stop:1152 length:360 start_codon:yes stop_codon:yes gene_type:complete
MDKTQQYIIRQSSIKTAVEYLSNQSDGSKYAGSTIADIFVLAEEIEKWVTRDGKTNNIIPKEEDKKWLNPKTPDWSNSVKFLQEEGDIEKIFNKFKVSKQNREELEKIIKNKNKWQQRQ